MTAMLSMRSWRRWTGVLLTATAVTAGCDRVVTGSPGAQDDDGPPAAELLLAPDRFPGPYRAAVLDGVAAQRALQVIDGVPAGAAVSPPGCAPTTPAAADVAVAEGIHPETASRLVVAVIRPAPQLSTRAAQLRDCASFTTGLGDAATSVTVTMLPAPPIDADESVAVDQSARTPAAQPMWRSLTLVAQIGAVRVSTTWRHDGASGAPDTSSLDTLFREAVSTARRHG
ncbi:hypothetical protein [Mycolicibacterium sp. XJ1819]